MTRLYGRAARVILLTDAGERFVFAGGEGGFRVTFNAKLTAKSSKNELRAELYNLRPNDQALFIKGATIVIEAGYRDLIGEIFKGQILHGETTRNAADLLTAVDATDGQAASSTSSAALSFKPGTSAGAQLQALLSAAGGDKGFKATIKEKLAAAPRGRSAFGLVTDELTNLLKPNGLEWSYQGDVLQVTEAGKPTSEPAILLGIKSGLVSARRLEGGRVKLLARIQPGLIPRRALELDVSGLDGTDAQSGRYVIDQVTFTGDTHGAAWTADVEASPV